MDATGTGTRSLKTAAAALRALRLLGDHPDGLATGEIAAALGKSPATARYLANTLCLAGYAARSEDGRIRLADAPPWGSWGHDGVAPDVPADPGDAVAGPLLAEAVSDLHRLTRQRTYLVRRSGSVVATVSDARGHRGLARVPGLGEHIPRRCAHALGLTRALLAASCAYREAVEREPLAALTPRTVTCVAALRREVDRTRERGWAVDDGEFAHDFATLAAPVTSPSGTSTVAVGLSCSTRRLAVDRDALVDAVLRVSADARAAWAAAGSEPGRGTPARQRPTSASPNARNRR